MIIHPKLETPVTAKYAKYVTNHFEEIKHFFFKDQPKICVIDSETTGLHLKKDKPFLWVFGWLIPKERRENGIKGRVFAFEHSSLLLLQVLMLAKQCNVTVGHNIKYDMHMMVNGGVPEKTVLDVGNWTDTMTVCRLIFEAVSDRDGGDNLSLKYVASKYIDFQATIFEDAVKRELRKINDERRNVLIALLKPYKGWGIGKIEDVYKVKTRGSTKIYTKERKKLWEEVPPEIEEVYFNWIDEYPLANYSEVPRDVITEYVHSDGIYTLEIAERGYPVVYARNQQNILKRENALIPVLFKQERLGMKVDLDYLRKCDALLRQEIYRNYKELWELTGRYFTVSQDQVIADYYEEQLSTRPESTDKAFLKKQKGDRVAKLISRLRRLEKWQSTYISRILEVAEYDGRFYTQFNPNGTVSGRISSDAQQFPKERILTEEGEEYEKIHGEGKAPQDMEIFCPRRAFIPDEKPYSKIAYFDLSQIELRVQANYTILLKRPDKNLCRAYMPLDCTHYQTGETYKFDEPGQRARWNEKQPDGRSAWIIPETGEPWVPTDVHSETAHNTLIALGYNCIDKYKMYKHMEKALVDELSFKEFWRKKGKIFNFMRKSAII